MHPIRYARAALAIRLSSKERLSARLNALRYAAQVKPSIAAGEHGVGPVWQFWAQGVDAAPTIIKRCITSVDAHCGRQHIVLDDTTISRHVDVPEYIQSRRGDGPGRIGHTAFSDLLRLYLLRDHGGTWIDASCFMSAPMPDHILRAPFFVFKRDADPFILSNWFIHSTRRHPFVVALIDALERYWREHDALEDYYMFHHLFEAMVAYHQPLRELFDSAPTQSSYPAHDLQLHFDEPYTDESYADLLSRSWLHKLTYKHQRLDLGYRSIWDHMSDAA